MSNTKLWAVTLFGLLVGWIAVKAAPALTPVLAAMVIAYLLHPAVLYLQKKMKIKKQLAIALLMVLIVALLVLLVSLILPPLVSQATAFAREFPAYSTNFEALIEQLQQYLAGLGLPEALLGKMDTAFTQLYDLAAAFLLNMVTAVFSNIFKLVDGLIIGVLLCYFLSSGPRMAAYVLDRLPERFRKSGRNLLAGTDRVIWTYVKTQLLIALIIGVVSVAAFMIIGIRYAFLLGVLGGILNLIPYFGSMAAGVLAALVALLTGGVNQAVITGIVVLVIQQLEGNLITPRLQAKSSGMHPVVIIAALLICNQLWGTVGMFAAVPIAGLAKLMWDEAMLILKEIQ